MQNKKYFVITIDTEADNQWVYENPITTENTLYLPRFQELCEQFNFKPVWLTDYEMASDERFVKYFKEKQDKGLCEIGMHLHGWSTPPEYELPVNCKERPFIYEYPLNIIEEKVKNITELLTQKFRVSPITHRAGRWAINNEYLSILCKYGYKIDCSVTPGINWVNTKGQTGCHGPDFSEYSDKVQKIGNMLEVPVSIKKIRCFNVKKIIPTRHVRSWLIDLLRELKNFNKAKLQWLRPDRFFNLNALKKLVDLVAEDDSEYLMFMIHSSELMPGGSPTFVTKRTIEKLYKLLEKLFFYIQTKGFEGITLKDFYMHNAK